MMVEPNTGRIVPRRRALLLAGVGLGSLGLAACGGAGNAEGQSGSSSSASSDGGASGESAGSGSATPNPSFRRGTLAGRRPLRVSTGWLIIKVRLRMFLSLRCLPLLMGIPRRRLLGCVSRCWRGSAGVITVCRRVIIVWRFSLLGRTARTSEKTITYVTELYEKGGWVIDGIQDIEYSYQPYIYGENYLWKIETKWLGVVYIQPDGQQIPQENLRTDDDTFWLECRHGDRGWYINSLLIPEEYNQKYKNQEKK